MGKVTPKMTWKLSLLLGVVTATTPACNAKMAGLPESGAAQTPDHASPGPTVSGDVLTQHNDVARTGVNPSETILTTTNVSGASFGQLFSLPVDGLIFAQPLYVSNFPIQGQSHNLLVVATAHNSVYAFDADVAGPPLWKVNLGASVPNNVLQTQNIQVEVGILSTPVISLDTDHDNSLIYLTTTNVTSSAPSMSLHALNLATGAEALGSPTVISATITGSGSTPTTFTASTQSQRPSLLLLGDTVYLGFASYEDRPPYHGWILAYRYDSTAHTLTQTSAFNVTPDGSEGGIWQSGAGLAADSEGFIYAISANGTVSVQNGGQSYGQAFLKLNQNLQVADWFVPHNYEELDESDIDLGSGGPVLVPGTKLVVGGGKQGVLYTVDTANMGHIQPDADQVVQSFQAASHIYGGPVVWASGGATRLYLWGVSDFLKGFELTSGSFNTTPFATGTVMPAPLEAHGNPCGIISLSSNGNVAGSAIVWGNVPTANPSLTTVPGVLYAFDALTLKTLWSSAQNPTRDGFGNYAKFVAPTIVNGKVYLATHSKKVVVYGLLPG